MVEIKVRHELFEKAQARLNAINAAVEAGGYGGRIEDLRSDLEAPLLELRAAKLSLNNLADLLGFKTELGLTELLEGDPLTPLADLLGYTRELGSPKPSGETRIREVEDIRRKYLWLKFRVLQEGEDKPTVQEISSAERAYRKTDPLRFALDCILADERETLKFVDGN